MIAPCFAAILMKGERSILRARCIAFEALSIFRHAFSRQPANSSSFGDLQASVGLTAPLAHTYKVDKRGRAARRAASQVSFHALRYTATSLMKNAGISPSIVQDIIGPDSAEMSANYTHVEHSAKKQALAALPDLSKPHF